MTNASFVSVAGQNAVHLLVNVGHEVSGGISALARVLKNLPANSGAVNDTEFYGRTPLMLGAINKSERSNILSLVMLLHLTLFTLCFIGSFRSITFRQF